MSMNDLLARLQALDIDLWSDDGRLRYSAPPDALTDELLRDMAAYKEEILQWLARAANDVKAQRGPIARSDRTGDMELSFAQQRLWFLEQLSPGSAAQVIPIAIRLEGPLDRDALERSLNEIVSRHEALRTRFVSVDGRPRQTMDAVGSIDVPLVDLQSLEPQAREQEVLRLGREASLGAFDLLSGPLLRARLVRLASRSHLLLLTMHHIVGDGWSLGVLFRELGALYGAYSRGQSSPLEGLPIQYADFARWQRQWLSGEVLESHLAYWRERLSGLAVLALPTDRRRPEVPTYAGAVEFLELPTEFARELQDMSRRAGGTLFMTMLSAFYVLLHRYSAQEDLVVGSPIANRNREELEGLIGCFVNMLLLRADLSGNPSFRELVEQVKAGALAAYEHQELPFEKLVDELEPERDLSRNPLFQVVFAVENTPRDDLVLEGLVLAHERLEVLSTRFDLEVHVGEHPSGLTVACAYSTDLFEAQTIRRMLGHYAQLLKAAARAPDCPIDQLPLLGEDERRQMLVEWNATQVSFPLEATVVELFESRASRSPESEALSFGARRMSYGELDEASSRLASWLRGQGVKADVPVGVLQERSVEMVVSWLGVLKAGGAYVPLDPEYPPERLAFMLENTGAPVLLTQASLTGRVDRYEGRVLCMDEGWDSLEGLEAGTGRRERPSAQSLAYIIYTSGSTGRPKGVAVPHASLANLVNWHNRAYEVTPADRATQVAGLGFDACVWEVWPYLAAGASVHLVEHHVRESPEFLWQWMCDRAVTLSFLPTPLAEALLRLPRPDGLVLRALLTGGDRLHGALADTLPFRLVNHYGPTENCVVATCVDVEAGDPLPPIGRPIDNVRAYVLDAHGQPVPIGVAGELHLAGRSLARGYWARADITAERFIEIVPKEGLTERAYRTGDRVCWRADGTLKFLGRTDEQVKVRGHRIELGEIEAVLSEQAGIREAVVLCREDAPGDKRLVAYVTTRGHSPMAAGELKGQLRGKLPLYMVPAAYVFLDELPLTPNGKVDRASLPAPEGERPEGDSFVMPSGDRESRIAAIWREVLRVEQVGAHDNFFDLGGDSIVSIQVVARLREAGLAVSTKDMFQHQTVAELARVAQESAAPRQPVRDVPVGDLDPTPVQHWFLEQELVGAHQFNQAVVLRARCAIDGKRLMEAFERVLAHHDGLRLRLADGAARRLHIVPPGGALPFVRVDLGDVEDAALPGVFEERAGEIQSSLNLAEGPALRAGYFDLGKDRPGLLLIAAHHLVVDGVSWRILLEDLDAAYEQAVAGQPVVLPPKTTSCRRWVEKLTDLAGSGALEADRAYWLSALEKPVAGLPVDDDRSRLENTMGNTGIVSADLDEESTAGLLRNAHRAYKTEINDLLLAALPPAFEHWTRASVLRVDLEGHGREALSGDVDLSRTVGWFTSIFPIDLAPGPDKEPGAAIKRVKESLRSVPHRGVSYGILRYLSPDQSVRERLRAHAGPEVSFNYLGQFDNMLGGSRRFEPVDMSAGRASAPTIVRRHLIDVVAMVLGGRLSVRWTYCTRLHRRQTIEALAQRYAAFLAELVRHCISGRDSSYTPSDFPHAELDQSKLDSLMAKVRRARGGSGR